MANLNYVEILRLKKMLESNNIPFELTEWFNGYAISYPSKQMTVCSAVEHNGSYGRNEDLIEIMGLLTEKELERDTVVGWLTAEDVFTRIKNHFTNNLYLKCN